MATFLFCARKPDPLEFTGMNLHLIPQPQSVRFQPGHFQLPPVLALSARHPEDAAVSHATQGLADLLRSRFSVVLNSSARGEGLFLETEAPGAAEGCRLSITPRRVVVTGRGTPGLFYGLQTLLQLVEEKGPRLPCLEIEEAPAFPHRGYYLDISRGKRPALKTLMALVDRLAALKINQLQLYVEHVYDFPFDRSIGEDCAPLASKEILALDRHCRNRHLSLVPSLTCFGHMGRILSLPPYRHLAEIEWPARDWASASWIQRLRGATINPRHPEARKLIEHMLEDYLPLFSSGQFNLCGDETYDLGRGANAPYAARHGLGQLYLDHLRFIRRVAARHGKRIQFWGDVLQQYPEAAAGIPSDCTVLDWGYYPQTPFEKMGLFIRQGLDTYACPSVRGYKTVFNEVEEARGNIAGYARAGLNLGAKGLLNTDWGDMGHFNMAGASLHGCALGAAMAWNPSSDEKGGFDQAFSRRVLGDASGVAGRLFVQAGSTHFFGWPFLGVRTEPAPRTAPRLREARRLSEALPGWAETFRALRPTRLATAAELEQVALACEAIGLNVEYTLLMSLPPGSRQARAAARRLSEMLRAFSGAFARSWKASNRAAGLDEIRRRIFQPFAQKLRTLF